MTGQEDAFTAVEIWSELFCIISDVELPTAVIALMTAAKTNASITAYSTAVGPDSSWRKFWIDEEIVIGSTLYLRGPLRWEGNTLATARFSTSRMKATLIDLVDLN